MSADIATLSIAVDSSQVKTATKDLDRLNAAGSGAAGSVAKLISALGLGVIIRDFFNVNREFQQLQAQLVTVTGSAEAAKPAFKFLEKFAEDTPFQLNEVVQAFTRLRSVGLDATSDSIKEFGDLAAANSKNLLDTIQGVISASFGEFETLKQYGIVARSMGDNVAITFKGVTTTVKNSSQAISEEVRRISRENFAGGMKRQMDTLGGVWSNLQDKVDAFLRSLGESGLGGVALSGIQGVLDAFDSMKAKIDELATDPDWWEFVSSFAIIGKQVSGLVAQLSSVIGGIAEAGVQTGFLSRMLQGVALLVAGIRDTFTLLRNLWGQLFVLIAEGVGKAIGFLHSAIAALPDALKKQFGVTDEVESRLTSLQASFEGFTGALGGLVNEMVTSSGSAYEDVMNDILNVQALAFKRAKEAKDKLSEGPGMLPATGAGNKGRGNFDELAYLREEAAIQKEINGIFNQRRAAMAAYEENQAALQAEASAMDLALDVIEPYRQELLRLSDAQDALNFSYQKGNISQAQLERGMENLRNSLPILTEAFGDLRDTFTDWSHSSADALVELAFTGKDAFRELINSMLRDLARLAVYKNVTSPLFNYVGTALNRWLNPAGPASTYQNTGNLVGSVPADFGMVGSGKGADSGTVSVTVNVSANGSTDVKAAGQGGVELARVVSAAVQQEIIRQQRPGGLMAGAR